MSSSRMLPRDVTAQQTQLSIFDTDLGWFGVAGRNDMVTALTFGHATPGQVHEWLLEGGVIDRLSSPIDWCPQLRKRLLAYAAGREEGFADVKIEEQRATPFQRRVRRALRNVGYGETLSYADLAERAGSPKAARAVGRVMATNRVPIIIPCHRVVASGKRLGGFSAPSGLDMKRRLLALEGVEEFCTAAT